MFQRFASVLFGDDVAEKVSQRTADPGFREKEEEDQWILVDYLADACSGPRLGDLREDGCDPRGREEEEEEEEGGAAAERPVRYASCSSLDSAVDTEAELDAEEEGFLRLERCSLEESWFITPPPCFTAGGRTPMLLETSPLENLLIEHPSMSVYAVHSAPHRLPLVVRDAGRHSTEPPLHRAEVQPQRRPALHTGCYAAALSARADPLEPVKPGRLAQRIRDGGERQQLSRNALRRFNLLRDAGARPARATGGLLHQPAQRHFNY